MEFAGFRRWSAFVFLFSFFALSIGRAAAQEFRLPNLTYATLNGYPLQLDLYLPTTVTQSTLPFPVLVYIHGGGWTEGRRAPLPRFASQMLPRGFAVASVSYRLTSEAAKWGDAGVAFPAQIHDVKGAVRWLRANAFRYHLDPARFAAWGDSAGGHLAALLGTSAGVVALEGDVGGNRRESSRIQAFVDYFGPTDLTRLNDDPTSPAMTYKHDAPGSYESKLLGFAAPDQGLGMLKIHRLDAVPPFPQLARLLDLANPITHVSSGDPPCFIAHGTADNLVPPRQSQRLRDAYEAAGLSVQYREALGRAHGALGLVVDRAAADFLSVTLGPLTGEHGDFGNGSTSALRNPAGRRGPPKRGFRGGTQGR